MSTGITGDSENSDNIGAITDTGDLSDNLFVLAGGNVINTVTFETAIKIFNELRMEYRGEYDMSDKTRLIPGDKSAQQILLHFINGGIIDGIKKKKEKEELIKFFGDDPIKINKLINLFKAKAKTTLPKFRTNWKNLFKDILNLKIPKNGETVVDDFMSYRLRKIKFKTPQKTTLFNELYEYNIKIWKLLYKNFFDGWERLKSSYMSLEKPEELPNLPSKQYLWHKFQFYGESIAYDSKEKKNR